MSFGSHFSDRRVPKLLRLLVVLASVGAPVWMPMIMTRVTSDLGPARQNLLILTACGAGLWLAFTVLRAISPKNHL